MPDVPDPDWYLDHVLAYAEPGRSGPIRPTEVDEWRLWWADRGAEVQARRSGLWARSAGFVLTPAAAAAAGADRALVRRCLRRGLWSSPGRGALALVGEATIVDGGDRWTADRRRHALSAAAAAILNPGHVVTGRTAAILHGLPTVDVPARPELTVAAAARVRRRGARSATLPATAVGDWYGIALTTAARTVVDVARHSRTEGIVVADAALRCRLTTRAGLRTALERVAGWPGARAAREICRLADPLAESPLESLTRLAIHDAGLPAPVLQAPIDIPGRRYPYYVDMLWPERRVVLECDGRLKYRERADLWREKRRQIALSRQTLQIERVVWDDVMRTWPATEARLRELLT